MPNLDVTDVLTDPDFYDELSCVRSASTTSEQGLTQLAQSTFCFFGVVNADQGEILERIASGERAKGSISVITTTTLYDAGTAQTADVVTWNGKQYTVVRVNDYSRYGPGFVEAICDLLPLEG